MNQKRELWERVFISRCFPDKVSAAQLFDSKFGATSP